MHSSGYGLEGHTNRGRLSSAIACSIIGYWKKRKPGEHSGPPSLLLPVHETWRSHRRFAPCLNPSKRNPHECVMSIRFEQDPERLRSFAHLYQLVHCSDHYVSWRIKALDTLCELAQDSSEAEDYLAGW